MKLTEFHDEMRKLGFICCNADFSWRRPGDGSIASQEAVEDICNLFSEKVQTFILNGWREGINQQFDIRFEDKDVVVMMRNANDGTITQSVTFKAVDVVLRP